MSNAGLIEAATPFGVRLRSASTISNSGTIFDTSASGEAVRIDNGSGVIFNIGTISGEFDGVVLTGGGTVTNYGSITGTYNVGVYMSGGPSMLIDDGTIRGSGTGVSVQFSGPYADLLEIGPESYLTGPVKAGSGSNTLELSSGTKGATGTLNVGLFAGFTTIDVDSGATWALSGGAGGPLGSGVGLNNAGTVVAGVTLSTDDRLDNIGTIIAGSDGSDGVVLQGAGQISNEAGGLIATFGSASTGYGVYAASSGATVANSGTIERVGFGAGGRVANYGLVTGGVRFRHNVAGYVTNHSTITGLQDAIYLAGGGMVVNAANAAIVISGPFKAANTLSATLFAAVFVASGAGTITNAGTISGRPDDTMSYGILLGDGGVVSNTGLISATAEALYTTGSGVATVINAGTILGGYSAVDFRENGLLANQAGGLIADYAGGDGAFTVRLEGTDGTWNNAGTIAGDAASSVYISGGVLTNTGLIANSGGTAAFMANIASPTLINAGTISGVVAVKFDESFTTSNLLVDDPGAVFIGSVEAAGSGASLLELAVGNGTQGTLTGFGSQFTGFETITTDAFSNWLLDSTDTIDSSARFGLTMERKGVLSIASLGEVLGSFGGIYAPGLVTISNAGIIGSGPESTGDGIRLLTGGTVSNTGAIGAGTVSASTAVAARRR